MTIDDDEDYAAKAYALVSQQINAWKGDGNDEMDHEMYDDGHVYGDDYMDDEDYNDDDDYSGNASYELRGVDRKDSIASNNSDRKQMMEFSPGGNMDHGSTNDYDMREESTSPYGIRLFHPLSSENNGKEYLQKPDMNYVEYYQILFTFLERKKSVRAQMEISNQQLKHDCNSIDENDSSDAFDHMKEEHMSIDLDYFQSLSKLCETILDELQPQSFTSNINSTLDAVHSKNIIRQMQFWKLLHLLRKHDDATMDSTSHSFLLPNVTTGPAFDNRDKPTPNIMVDIHSSPPQILRKLFYSNPKFRRRYLLLQWISSSLLSSKIRSIHLPPHSRNIMWPVLLSQGQVMDPDAPLRSYTQQSNTKNRIITSSTLPGTDESDEIDFLKALLRLYQCNQIKDAIQLCDDVGQPWRASTFFGGLLLPFLENNTDDEKSNDMEDTQDDNVMKKWNSNYFLWKQQCSKLAEQTLEYALHNTRTKEPPSILYESAFYSILSGDLNLSLNNPIMRTWEEALYIHFHAALHRTMDETLIQHCNAQRKVGKRFPFKGYTTSTKLELAVMERTFNNSKFTEEAIFDALSTSSYDVIKEESTNTLRVLTSCVAIGKEAVIQFIQDYVSDVEKINLKRESQLNQSTTKEISLYLPAILHFVLYLDNALSSFSEIIHQAAQTLLLKYMQDHLYPIPSLWKCIALYTSLLSNEDIQMNEYKTFLKSVTKPVMRKDMMDRARSFFPSGMDLNIVKLLLDEAYTSLVPENKNSMTKDDIKKKMQMIQWTLFYPEHRFDAVWYANIFLRQLLLELKSPYGSKYLSYAQDFLEIHFPGDSVEVLQSYYDNEEMICTMEEEEAELLLQDVQNVTEEHEGLCAFVDANTAYEAWRVCLIRSSDDIRKTYTTASPQLQNNKLNSIERDIITKMQDKDRARKVQSIVDKVIEAAKDTETLLRTIIEHSCGWLTISESLDESHSEELNELRKVCLPRTVFLWHKLCLDMGDWMESILLADELESIFRDVGEIMQPHFWYRKALSIANVVAQDQYRIRHAFSNEEMKQFMQNMKDTGIKILQCSHSEKSIETLTLKT